MEKYHISPKPAHAMFVDAIHRYLIWACVAAVILAVVLSYLMMRRVLAPLTRMTVISRDIASGNFSVRVPEATKDEVGQLAHAFNKMAKSLEAVENLRRSLMIDVAHELRTPLTNIRGYLEALNDHVLPPSTSTFSLLQDETLRLADLVEEVLELARADASRGHLDLQSMDLIPLIITTVDAFSRRFTEKSITLKGVYPEKPLITAIDPGRMARVVRNLTDNAVRYTPKNGVVHISFETAPGNIRIVYANPRGELSASDLPYIFERFYRGEKSRSRQHGGAGIGLSIVKELVEAHGGKVGAEIIDDQVRIWVELPIDSSGTTGESNLSAATFSAQ
jgi:signal transduction histidine kinase